MMMIMKRTLEMLKPASKTLMDYPRKRCNGGLEV